MKNKLEVDDIVLAVDNNCPQSQWSLGRIVETYPDEHGAVRSVLVRINCHDVRRPIHKLCLIQPARENSPSDLEPRVLREVIQGWNQAQIHDELHQRGIQWSFNSPAASHMGGVWERLIHSVRRALLALSNERKMNEDQLRIFLSEAESIVNSSPLTPVTLVVDSDLPLTPNHFLKLSASSGLPPVVVGNGDCQPHRGGRFVQHVSDQFWRRFSKEYLRTILQWQKRH